MDDVKIVSVQIAPWVLEAKKHRERRAKEEWEYTLAEARIIPAEELEYYARTAHDKDVAEFFVHILAEKDKGAALRLGRELGIFK